jgi:glycosyltransferase involved in cell wall biosynthesis
MGGAEQVLLNILRGTDKEKYSYHIITTQPANNVWRSKFKTSFQNIVTPTNKTKDIFYYDKIYYKYFRYIISKLEVNIVLITNSVVGYQFLPQLKSEFKKVKFVDVLHAENYPEVNLESMAPYIDKRVCISNRLKAHLVKRYRKFGLGEKYIERLNVIYNGIDTAEYKADSRIKGRFKTRFSIPENTKLISFVGRLREEKNPLLFVEIAKNIMAKSPDELKFVIAGDGPDFDKVKNKIKNYGLENQVLLTRAIDYVPDLLNDTYILLVVSKTEGIPLVILEAMSMGVPVISTDVGAISEVVENNVNGFLINANNSDAEVVDYFTSKTLGLIMEKMDYHTFSEKAKETIISNFTLEIMGSKYEKVFEELTKS